MSISNVVAPHLPYLRRFARALSGSQQSGDAYVVATLETLIADPEVLTHNTDVQAVLYRLFLKIWNSLPHNGKKLSVETVEGRLNGMTPVSRQAFLLTAMEGFSSDRAALALDVDRPTFDALSDLAAREVAEQIATNVLIIEDEPIIAMDLESIVGSLGHRVIDIATTYDRAVKAAAKERPGLILADIQLADGSSGLDAVNDILRGFEIPVIFITAFPERLLTGERPEPVFLLTKPFSNSALIGIISQALYFDEKSRRTP